MNALTIYGPDGKPIKVPSNTDELWITSPENVTPCLNAMRAFRNDVDLPSISNMERLVAFLRDKIVAGELNVNAVKWQKYYLALGNMTLLTLGSARFDDEKFCTLLIDKHKRYGTKSLTAWRHLGILTRIDQKIARATRMVNDPKLCEGDTQGESLNDTMVDIVGYCVLGLYMVEWVSLFGGTKQ